MKFPFRKNKNKQTETHQDIKTGGPKMGVNDLPQTYEANGTWNTQKSVSPNSAHLDNIKQISGSTKPETGVSANINIGTFQPYTSPNTTYKDFMSNGMIDATSTQYVWSVITYFKEFQMSMFKYTGVEFDPLYLEECLFLYGRVVVIKLLDEYYILPFDIVEKDLNEKPIVIKPTRYSNEKMEAKFEKLIKHTKEKPIPYCVNDANGMFKTVESFSPVFRHWFHFQNISNIRIEILNNIFLGKGRLFINVQGKSDNEVKNLVAQWNSGSPLVFGDIDSMLMKYITGQVGLDGNLIEMEERSDILWFNFKNIFNELKVFMGARTNAGNTEKGERMVNDEINVDNQMTELTVRTKLEIRKQFIERCNKAFGWNATVELNEVNLQSESDKYNNDKQDLKKGKEEL